MQIFVKSITGDTITLVDVLDTVDNVKERIQEIEGIPVEEQRLIFSGREILSGHTLTKYNIQQDNTIHLLIHLNGGYLYDRKLEFLASVHMLHKKICRKCYGRLPPSATRCHKVKCGRTSNIREKKCYRYGRTEWPKRIMDWEKRVRLKEESNCIGIKGLNGSIIYPRWFYGREY